MAGDIGEITEAGKSSSVFKAESTEISNLAEGIFSTYHCEFIGNDSTAGLKDCIHRGSYTRHQLYYTG